MEEPQLQEPLVGREDDLDDANYQTRYAARGAIVLIVGLAVSALAGCAPSTPSEYEGVMNSRAVSTCEQLFGGADEPELLAAVDSTIEEARDISAASGLDPDEDLNFSTGENSDYLALCLVSVDGSTYLYYQFDGEFRSGAIAKY